MEYNTIVVDAISGEITTEFQEQPIIDETIKVEYKSRVVELLRQKYDINAEFEVHREKESHPENYLAFTQYLEQCKTQAREESNG